MLVDENKLEKIHSSLVKLAPIMRLLNVAAVGLFTVIVVHTLCSYAAGTANDFELAAVSFMTATAAFEGLALMWFVAKK